MCLIQLPITKESAIGTTCVTPSPESTTVPVKSFEVIYYDPAFDIDVTPAYNARTA